jgi:raffinose/stachyose/melibiose transport system substrate-binding protein
MKRLVSFLALSLSVILLFSGCSGKAPNSTTGPKQTLTVYMIGGTDNQAMNDYSTQLAKSFDSSNKYNVTLDMQYYENDQYKTKLATLMAADTAPDIFFTWEGGYLSPFVNSGRVYEIGKTLNKDTEWKNRFLEGIFGPVTFNNKIYAVPHAQSLAVVYYNTKLFDQAGVTVPKTFDELLADCKTFNSKNITPMAFSAKDAWIPGELFQQLSDGIGGSTLYNNISSGKAKWNDPQFVQAGNELAQLVNAKAFVNGFLGMSQDEGRALFTQEKAAMYYMGSWDTGVLSSSSSDVSKNIGAFLFPVQNSSAANVEVASVDMCLAVSSKCKNIPAACDFIKEFSTAATQTKMGTDLNYLISTKTQIDKSKLSPLVASINALQNQVTTMTPWYDRMFGAGLGGEFNNAAQAICGGQTPQTQLDALEQYAQSNASN